jgi:hypothetical protein
VLRVLSEHKVEFVLIGGVAVAMHGYVRGTNGIDIVPAPNPENLTRLWNELLELEATPAEEMPIELSLEALIGGGNWAIDTRLGRLDVVQRVEGIEGYDELRANAERVDEPSIGRPIWVAGLDNLISMKEATGRDIDRIDITALRMAQGLEE